MKEFPETKHVKAENAPAEKSKKLSRHHIELLKTQLAYFVKPDFANGNYWCRLDRRLYELMPELIAQTIHALEVGYPPKHHGKNVCHVCCAEHGRDN